MKEIKLSPNITEHDISYRVKQANKFLEQGHQVKVTLAFRGRERVHEEIGWKTMEDFVSSCTSGAANGKPRITDGKRKFITAHLNPKGKQK
jgi:translation initiation factor IF-3